jgi:hypothetical protein
MVAWPPNVNTKAYGMSVAIIPNFKETEFESGKPRRYLINSSPKRSFTFNIEMTDDGSGSEYKAFLAWFTDVLLSGVNTFSFPNLITHTGLTEYWLDDFSSSGQLKKEVSLSVREA